MKFSESWLRTFVNPALSSHEISRLLTMAGLEVEEMKPVAPAFEHVVVAKILETSLHPDADRLKVCTVDAGEKEPRQIVCGAPNAAAGMKVPCALAGAVLPGNLAIKVTKVRGVESFGMLCSEKELGLSEESSGLMELPPTMLIGESLRAALDLDDQIFTLKLTPNRADCLSLSGIARELSALTGEKAAYPAIVPAKVESPSCREISLLSPDACPRYCGRVISQVDAKAKTPEWMRRRLERSGLRSISALVDVTNYILLELGQPLHAFDNAKLSGKIYARMAKPGEEITLLNDETLALNPDVLLIADDKAPQAMAGIMGSKASGITLETTEVFLESAFFAPHAISGKARRYNFSSDASHRYERGVDYGNCLNALERATALILEICGGKAGTVTEALAQLPERLPVRLRCQKAQKVLGIALTPQKIAEILNRLSLPYTQENGQFLVSPPSYRFDIEIEADLIEEIARIYGYDNIPAAKTSGRLAMLPQPEKQRHFSRIRQQMADCGFQEVVNFAFVPEHWEHDFSANNAPIRLANPISSQLSVMRSSLIGGLIDNLVTNLRRKQTRVRLFEQGRCFLRHMDNTGLGSEASCYFSGYSQPWRLAALIYGPACPEGWGDADRKSDFFDLKGRLETLFAPHEIGFRQAGHPALHPGKSANILLNGKTIGFIGELHPNWASKYELPAPPVVFEILAEAVTEIPFPVYEKPSKFQIALRDLAVIVDQKYSLEEVLSVMKKASPAFVQDIRLFDLYQGKGIPEKKKSLAFRIVMQDTEGTFLDTEIDAAVAGIISALEKNLAAQLRA